MFFLGGCVVGLGLGLYIALTHRPLENILGGIVAMAIVAWPFSVRSQVGRCWWSSWLLFVACLIGIRVAGTSEPARWLLVALAAVSCGITACLRWRTPAAPAHE